ncbi:COX15/CtaA family protein [Anaplasma ovis]|uniref:COX15/CtaA family protein n=1 Tax=Anaplasma ovis TaxID=142058 RepID=UPI001F3783FD|nr:COX15/CtaA family protein [Anaplasma ovis]
MWLGICCFMTLLMVVIGGITRLTHSGLSITEWQPVIGVIPPMSDEAWLREKAKYAQTPEYKHRAEDISLDDFKRIYIIEYIHRLFGRALGAVFCLPIPYFAITKRISRAMVAKLLMVALLGGMQGAMGWFMVKSGLVGVPRVSHYRLAGHLFLTILLFSILWHSFLRCAGVRSATGTTNAKFFAAAAVVGLTVLQMVLGALVAGLDAGLTYNTFPLMDGAIIPQSLFSAKLWHGGFLCNVAAVQFLHRLVAVLIVICAALLPFWLRARGALLFLACVVLQFLLGVATLVSVVHIVLAAMHQVFSFVVLASGVYMLCGLRLEGSACISGRAGIP